MAESAIDKLRRLAAEKKLAQAQPVAEAVSNESSPDKLAVTAGSEEAIPADNGSACGVVRTGTEVSSSESSIGTEPASEPSPIVRNDQPVALAQPVPTSDHPLAMQFAELEAALLTRQPEFKTILRQIHRHLGQEPELVTQMSEQEIQMVVSGLIVFANAEVVAPAKEKTAKAKIAAEKKKVVTVDDL